MDLNGEQIIRYRRHLILPEVGVAGQKKLLAAKVLCIGAGGLGCPISIYLTAAGVGTIGLADIDVVSPSNLQRQILFSTRDVGEEKVKVAARKLRDLNPDVKIIEHQCIVKSDNVLDLLRHYDVVVDGTDNFPTRYCVNDACVILKKPNVYGSIFRFEGMISVLAPHLGGPCYRCLYPQPPEPGTVPSCAEGGVMGVLPGIVGTLQANEVIKLIVGIGQPAIGKLTTFDALNFEFRSFKVKRDINCPVCGESPTITAPIDYEQFCGVPIMDPKSQQETNDEVSRAKAHGQGVGLDERGLPPGYPFKPDWEVTPRGVKSLLDRGEKFVFIDCRLQNEHDITHIDGATLLPLQQLPQRFNELADKSNEKVIVYCRSGNRSLTFAQALRNNGFKDVKSMAGGILLWNKDINPGGPQY